MNKLGKSVLVKLDNQLRVQLYAQLNDGSEKLWPHLGDLLHNQSWIQLNNSLENQLKSQNE